MAYWYGQSSGNTNCPASQGTWTEGMDGSGAVLTWPPTYGDTLDNNGISYFEIDPDSDGITFCDTGGTGAWGIGGYTYTGNIVISSTTNGGGNTLITGTWTLHALVNVVYGATFTLQGTLNLEQWSELDYNGGYFVNEGTISYNGGTLDPPIQSPSIEVDAEACAATWGILVPTPIKSAPVASGLWAVLAPTPSKSAQTVAGAWSILAPTIEKIVDASLLSSVWTTASPTKVKIAEPDPGAGLAMSPGSWNILFNGLTSVDLTLTATENEVYDAILAIIVGGGVTVVAKEAGTFPNNGGGYRVTFDSALGDVALMAIEAEVEQGPSRYTFTVSEVSGYTEEVTPIDEVATVNVPGTPGDPWTFKLGKTGETQEGEGYELAWDATASEVQAAIDYLYGTGAATTSGGPLGGGYTPVVVTWNGSLAATNVPDLFVSYSMIGATVTIDAQGRAGVASRGEVQDIVLSISPCLVPAELAWGILSPTIHMGFAAFKYWLSTPTIVIGV